MEGWCLDDEILAEIQMEYADGTSRWVKAYHGIVSWWSFLIPFRAAHEAAIYAAKLRVELSQSRSEQQEYLKNVELARVLDKRAEKKRERGEEFQLKPLKERPKKRIIEESESSAHKKSKLSDGQLDTVLGNIF